MSTPEQAQERINGFDILDQVGAGGMGIVYRARQVSIDRLVALKVLHAHLAADKLFVNRLREEARAMGRLDHPNIIRAVDAGEEDGRHWFAMEFVDGLSVAEMLRRDGALPWIRALDVVIQVAEALDYACGQGMIHLDIKPGNIIVPTKGPVKLGDFGLARRVGEGDEFMAEKEMVFGTPRYMSPEHLRFAARLDTRSDIFSLGVTFYEMLTGISPFRGDSKADMARNVRELEPPPVTTLAPDVPVPLADALQTMLRKDRRQRYANPARLLQDLHAAALSAAPAPTPPVIMRDVTDRGMSNAE